MTVASLTAGRALGQGPSIVAFPPTIQFPSLTVGSTASDSLILRNAGTAKLEISSIEAPVDVTVTGAAEPPILLSPSEAAVFRVVFHPRSPNPPATPLRVLSNDPLRPILEIPLQADVRSIAVRARAIVRTPAPLGEAATIQAHQDDPLADLDDVVLSYRRRGTITFTRQDMFSFDDSWAAIVPGSSVGESGVEFFVESRHGDVTFLDPPEGAAAPHAFDVAPPTEVAVTPQRTSRSGFAVNVDIPVRVDLPVGSQFERGQLHYRLGGKVSFDSTALLQPDPNLHPEVLLGTIPGAAATARGLEYWVSLRTLQTDLRLPPAGAPASSDTIRVTVSNLQEPKRHAAGRYRMVSVPLGYGAGSGVTLETILSDQPEFGPYDPFRWRAFRWQADSTYAEFVRGDTTFVPDPGRAFWLICSSEHAIDTAPVDGLSTSRPRDVRGRRIRLAPGWNQIANPFAYPILWSDVTISDTTAVTSLTAFDPDAGPSGDWAPESPAVLQPFDGYFIFNRSQTLQSIWMKPLEAGEPGENVGRDAAATAMGCPPRPASLDSWRLIVAAHTAHAVDRANSFGVDPLASDFEDALDRIEPPFSPGAWVRLAFANPKQEGAGVALRRDLRAGGSAGHAWDLEVTVPGTGALVTLEWMWESALPAELAVRLLDRETGASVDLVRPGANSSPLPGSSFASYQILAFGSQRGYRLTLLAGTDEYVAGRAQALLEVPAAIALDQNAPNPFNATTRIRFALPSPAGVTLEVFNVRGERVSTLLREEPRAAGYHTVLWNGTDPHGRALASGVYLCLLRTSETTLTRRLVLLE